MYADWTANLIVVLGNVVAVGASVLVHYEGLNLLSQWLARRREHHPRRKVLYGIFGVLSLHIIEIWIFGLTLWVLLMFTNTGSVAGGVAGSLLDAVYLSANTYTTRAAFRNQHTILTTTLTFDGDTLTVDQVPNVTFGKPEHFVLKGTLAP